MDFQCDRCESPFSSSLLPTPAQTAEVAQHLRSNSIPSDPSSLHAVIASSPVDVARYDAEIRRLISERDALQRYSDECRSIFAPVRRLPPEILVEIFTLCSSTPTLYCDGHRSIPNDKADPVGQPHLMHLLRVCSAWHTTVMVTPSLWANIKVDLDAVIPQRIDKKIRHLSRSLDRSGHSLLTIRLIASSGRFESGLKLLERYAERWRSVDLCVSEGAASLLSRVRGNLPRLECLALGGDGMQGIDIFELAPNLTRIILSDVDGPLPKLPWSQMREITFYSSHPRTLDEDSIANRLATMSHCSDQCEFNIHSLNLTYFDADVFALIPLRVESNIPVLRLAILDRRGEEHSRSSLGKILGVLTLSCLQELHFRSSRPDDEPLFWPRDDFSGFASRSCFGDTMTKLFLCDMVITKDELVGCLSDMKILQELFIQDVGGDFAEDHILIDDGLLERLVWRADSSCLVPNLNKFSFASLFFFDDTALMEFVQSRVISGGTRNILFRIEAFNIIDSEPNIGIVGDGFGVVAIAGMEALERQGLLRWSRHGRKTLRQKVSNLNLF